MRAALKSALVVVTVVLMGALFAPPGSARSVWDTSPTPSVTRDVTPTPHVADLRYGQHATYDRVVIDTTGPIPGYDVRYVKELRYDPSGRSVP